MNLTVQFDNQIFLGTIKIGNEEIFFSIGLMVDERLFAEETGNRPNVVF
ncbi:MAG: hypothetical protein JJU13_04055 [Balneolaceae bacterium]|nr:hypothetical protein [Balneolaceae bacterium]